MAIEFLYKKSPNPRNPFEFLRSDSTEFATLIETVIEAGDFTFAAENGTVTAPSFTFSSDTNTGIYRISADRLGITAGGSLIAEFYTSGGSQYFSVEADYMQAPVGNFTTPGITFRSGVNTYLSGISVETNSKSLIFHAQDSIGTSAYIAAATMNVGFAGEDFKQFLVAPNASAGVYPAFAFWHNNPVAGEQVTGIDSQAYTSIDAVVNATRTMRWEQEATTFYGNFIYGSTPQALSGPGAVNVTTYATTITTTGVDAFTLADGTTGQRKIITMIVDGGNGTLTPTNLLGYTTITFGDVGDSVELMFIGSKWAVISNSGCVLA